MKIINGAPNAENIKPLKFKIDGEIYETTDQYKTGANLKELAGIPQDVELFLAIKEPYEDELILNDDDVNLARPEVESFFTKKNLKFFINDVEFISYKQHIKGIEIRELGNISDEFDVYLDIKNGWDDDLIRNNEEVDLARPGKEHFITKEKLKEYKLIVNAREKCWKEENITFKQVVELAFGKYDDQISRGYTVTYSSGPKENKEGFMIKGTSVNVKNKMIFDVTATSKS